MSFIVKCVEIHFEWMMMVCAIIKYCYFNKRKTNREYKYRNNLKIKLIN